MTSKSKSMDLECNHKKQDKLCTKSCHFCGYCLVNCSFFRSNVLICIDCWNHVLTVDERGKPSKLKDRIGAFPKGIKKIYS